MARVSEKIEMFEIFDDDDQPLGFLAPRSECHGDPSLIHRTAHVVVFNSKGQILLQKRSSNKDVQPNKWDTAVGGHLNPGESYEEAAYREMSEELGVFPDSLEFLFKNKIRNEIESENIGAFKCVHDGPFKFDRDEIDAIRFWSIDELNANIGKGVFTPNLEEELQTIFSNTFFS